MNGSADASNAIGIGSISGNMFVDAAGKPVSFGDGTAHTTVSSGSQFTGTGSLANCTTLTGNVQDNKTGNTTTTVTTTGSGVDFGSNGMFSSVVNGSFTGANATTTNPTVTTTTTGGYTTHTDHNLIADVFHTLHIGN
jgi:hypothetical protein